MGRTKQTLNPWNSLLASTLVNSTNDINSGLEFGILKGTELFVYTELCIEWALCELCEPKRGRVQIYFNLNMG